MQEDCEFPAAWATDSRSGASFFLLLVITEPNWAQLGMTRDSERTKDRETDMQKVGARCVGHSDVDTQQPHCVCSLLYSLHLLCFFSLSLFFKA
jgi:hypothetical protein